VIFLPAMTAAQQPPGEAPYRRFPVYPPVKLLLPDSSTYYSKADLPKKSPVLLVLFNPQCSHCQQETEEIIRHIDLFKDVQIVMATSMPFDSMLAFRDKYRLPDYKNIVVGQDTHYFLPTFYNIRNLPFLAFYNRKKELIDVFEGTMPPEKIIGIIRK
jgi:thioredoxin-related protein